MKKFFSAVLRCRAYFYCFLTHLFFTCCQYYYFFHGLRFYKLCHWAIIIGIVEYWKCLHCNVLQRRNFIYFFINTKKGNNLDGINFTINNARTVACINKRNRFNNDKEVKWVNFIQILFEFSIFKMLQIFVN